MFIRGELRDHWTASQHAFASAANTKWRGWRGSRPSSNVCFCWHKRQTASALSCFLRLPPSINKPLVTSLSTANNSLRDLVKTKSEVHWETGQWQHRKLQLAESHGPIALLLHLTACDRHSSVLFGWPQVGLCKWDSLASLFSKTQLSCLDQIAPNWASVVFVQGRSKDLFSFPSP